VRRELFRVIAQLGRGRRIRLAASTVPLYPAPTMTMVFDII
jgi:hypothetical protein